MDRRWFSAAALLGFASVSLAAAELPSDEKLKPQEVARVAKYTEGVVFDRLGRLYFSSTSMGSIFRLDPNGKLTTWATPGGPNGHKILADGSHLVCDLKHHAVIRLDTNGNLLDKPAAVCDGKPLREPNDLTVAADGSFYFTDPADSNDTNLTGTVHFADGHGKVLLCAEKLAYPNGIVLRPDGKSLLVAESKKNRILAYPVEGPGKLGPQKVFADLPSKTGSQVDNQPDGICLDAAGNLYVAHFGMGQVQVLDPDGKLIRRYTAGNLLTSNVAFGGPGGTQLFVSGSIEKTGDLGAVFRLDLGVPGLPLLGKP